MSTRVKRRLFPAAAGAAVAMLLIFVGVIGPAQAGGARGAATATASSITFGVPTVVYPIHTNGEPDIGIDPQGRVFVSGPTGTGTQRSTWFGSVDGGQTFRVISPGPPPSAISGIIDPPGGGDTDIAFDHTGKQYFTDLYALICLRSATTADGGATTFQSIYPAGCAGIPGADRQWLAVYDPPPGTPNQSAYTGPKPLIYQEYNDLLYGAEWVKSSAANDTDPGGPGLNYVNATNGGPGTLTGYAPFGADGYPSIDQVTGKVFQAEFHGSSILLNIGTPDADGNLTFLDYPDGDLSKLITVATGQANTTGEAANFVVTSMDSARNLYVVWVGKSDTPRLRQTYVSASTAKSGWTKWTPPLRVSSPPSQVSVFPWIKAGGAGRADAVWYGSDMLVDPSSQSGQAWDVYMSQLVYPVDATGAINGQAAVTQVKVTPHPMHYNDICLAGTGCIEQQGNRNLADFFAITIDATGAAEVVYDDTSNGLIQQGFDPGGTQIVDHAGAGVITIARQNGGPGLFGTTVTGASNAPVAQLGDHGADALYPVIGGANVPGFDVISSAFQLSTNGQTLRVTLKVADLAHPDISAGAVPGTVDLDYVTRWQMGNTIYYAAMQNTAANQPSFYAGAAQSIDLCSVSACFPHVIIYPEPAFGGHAETGRITCPATPSAANPCTITIQVNVADVGAVTATSLLEEIGAYAMAASHPEGSTTNAQAEADNVPLEIDGVCCFNFQSSAVGP